MSMLVLSLVGNQALQNENSWAERFVKVHPREAQSDGSPPPIRVILLLLTQAENEAWRH